MNKFMQGVEFSHFLLEKFVDQGDQVLDATAGNGYDTLFLARLVGSTGQVWSFDIQQEALDRTRAKLIRKDYQERVELVLSGHEKLDQYIDSSIQAAVFNLGYLPGSDKDIVTTAKNTVIALDKTLKLLYKGGIAVLVIYTGHDGGLKEKQAVVNFCTQLEETDYNVLHYHFINQSNNPAQVLAIRKRKG